jgi:hypothetical protein
MDSSNDADYVPEMEFTDSDSEGVILPEEMVTPQSSPYHQTIMEVFHFVLIFFIIVPFFSNNKNIACSRSLGFWLGTSSIM